MRFLLAQELPGRFAKNSSGGYGIYWPGYEPLTLINPQGLPRDGFENLLATSTYSLVQVDPS